jgi:isopenicillin-N N-acyltransferase-like protein
MPARYPHIEVSGTPRKLGEQLGEATREQIRGFAAIAVERVNKTVPVSRARALEVARACIPHVRAYAPDLLEELEGVAAGSGLDLDELMLLQIRNQLRPEGACTGFALAAGQTAIGQGLVAQNWDNDPALDPFTVVLTRRPAGKPAMLDVTQAGLIAYIGLSAAGVGVCLNTLPAPSRERGVPHYFTVRRIFEARTLAAAVAAVERAQRAIPANILLSTPEGPADLEVTLDAVQVLRDEGTGVVTHTNHCLHPDLLAINQHFPELIQSVPRKARIDELLAGLPRPVQLAGLQEALRDHQQYPCSICRHQNGDPATGFLASVFSVIAVPEAGCLYVARGNPCAAPYETYRLS